MIETKHCSRCGLEKPLTEFSKNKQNHARPKSWCKQCCREVSKNFAKTASGVYSILKGQTNFTTKHQGERDHRGFKRVVRKPLLCTRKEFIKWYEAQPRVCVYCDIHEEDLPLIEDTWFNNKQTRLSIDVVDNTHGYSIDNMVLSCGRCNMIKSDFFTFDEMKEVGKIIKRHWEPNLIQHKI
jgi:hypothetical protein